jgi:hypothetical protein
MSADNVQECAKYARCSYRINVGSCPEGCNQFKHKNEKRVVLCSECRYQEDCPKMMIVSRRDPATGLKLLEYHRMEYCSAGINQEDGYDR